MATYTLNNPFVANSGGIAGNNVPAQSFNITLPEDGQVFRGVGDNSNLYMRQGNNIYSLNLNNSPWIAPGSVGMGDRMSQVQQTLGARGLDFNSLPQINMADLQGYGSRFGLTMGSLPVGQSGGVFAGGTPDWENRVQQFITQNQKYTTGTAEAAKASAQQASDAATAKKAVTANASGAAAPNQFGSVPGSSLVDFLNGSNLPSSFAYRNELAKQAGITGYVGSPDQNNKIMGMLKGGQIDMSKIETPTSQPINMTPYNPSGAPGTMNTPFPSVLPTDMFSPSDSPGAPIGAMPGAQGNEESFINNKSFSFFNYLEGLGTSSEAPIA